MSDVKIQVLIQLLNQLEDELNNLFHMLEDEEGISDEKFSVYDKKMDDIFRIKRDIKDEIYYS